MNAHLVTATRRSVFVNRRRAEFKRELKSGDTRLSALLRAGIPDWLGSIDAERLLLMAPRVGRSAAFSLLLEAHLGPMQQARFITTRQRLLLAGELEKIEALTHREPSR